MTIFYVANIRLPTEKAHGLQIVKMCEAFASNVNVELIIPRRFNSIKADPFEYYGIKKSFKITRLPILDLVKFGRFGFLLESLIFSKVAAIYLFFKKTDIIYGRDEFPLYFLSFFKRNIFWEAHQGQINFMARRLLKKAAGIIGISNGLRNFYIEKGANPEKISVFPDAVDFNAFNISLTKEECLRKLRLPLDKKIILYSGHLYGWKGADVLLKASSNFDDSFFFVFVGGTVEDIKNYKLKTADHKPVNILFAGHRPHAEVPLWLKAADVLVLPNSEKEEISRLFTSPLKLFEYMASGTPIIASDLPSIREVASDNQARFFEPDNSDDLSEKIKYAFGNEAEMRTKAESARRLVQKYTWASRAENILSFISKNLKDQKMSDFWPGVLAGLGIAVLALPILKNLSLLDFLFSANQNLAYSLVGLWLIFVPLGAVFGLYLARLLGRKRPMILQLARYGLIGVFNTFVHIGVFNFLSWLTGVATGFEADFLFFVAFSTAVTNSFFWNKYWVFGHSDSGQAKLEYAKFFGVTGFTALLNILLFHFIVNTFGAPSGIDEKIWANIAILLQIPVSFLFNFFGYKIFVFKKKF